MIKILAVAALMLAGTAGVEAQEPPREHAVDVSKPSFINIMLRRPQIFDELPKDQNYTIFAPTEEAFSQLNPEIRDKIFEPEFAGQLEKLMHYHIIVGEHYVKDLTSGMVLKSVEGKDLVITEKDGQIMINEASIVDPDGISGKGVVHQIDRVLVPDDLNFED